jgi:hypothetical protein
MGIIKTYIKVMLFFIGEVSSPTIVGNLNPKTYIKIKPKLKENLY